jgi:hypothetical protein
MFLETGRFQPACIRSIENGIRHYLDFGRNIGFQKLNGKEWIIFSRNCGEKQKQLLNNSTKPVMRQCFITSLLETSREGKFEGEQADFR